MLQRTAIRKAIQSRLLGHTAAGAHVFTSRVKPWREADLPGISIYTSTDPVDADSRKSAPRIYERNLQVKIDCADVQTEDMDDRLDELDQRLERLQNRLPR